MKSRLAVLLAASAAFSFAHAQTKWDMPTPYADGEFHTRNIKAFVEDVKQGTNGALDIALHANGSLIKHPDILRAVSTGQVNIAEFLLGQFGNEDPVFAADNVPFVATGYDNAWKFYQAQKPLLEKKLDGRGLKLLFSVPWPGLPDGALAPGYAGIRPKTAGPKEPAPDFAVQGPSVHGVPGLVHLFGIESPGLTSSLALADIALREVS